jgi:APA family basic amino acid/polyamine antiporter
VWQALTRRKALATFREEEARDNEKAGARMTLFDLLCVGVGGTVGSGVFVLSGQVAPVAGPSAALSWCLAGAVCSLSALSYMELSARIPTKGSCYAFSFHALGELPAVVGAVCLTLE